MPKHITRLIILLVVVAMLFIGGKTIFSPKSFGVYGHYRAASVEEIAGARPKYVGSDSFAAGYPKEYAAWSTGIHKVVQCQICHMAVGKSPNDASRPTATPPPATPLGAGNDSTKPALPMPGDSRLLCPKCHQRISGRPDVMPQIDLNSHGQGGECTACHNPHSPLFTPAGGPIAPAGGAVAGTADVAAGRKLSATCAACHGPVGVSAIAAFPNLACQKQAYLIGALMEYQSGKRANPVMSGIAKGLSAADAQNVTAYFSGLPCGK